MKIRWTFGDVPLQEVVEEWLAGQHSEACEVLAETAYRRTVKLSPPAGSLPYAIVIKEFRPISASWALPKRLLAVLKHVLRWTPADREWRALSRVRSDRLRVPEPLARANLARART